MRPSSNKFIKHLADDIVNQNHHLKTQIIKVRKVLKNYEQIMVQQFVKLSKQLGVQTNQGFFFQTPQEYLKYFVELINRNIHKSSDLQMKNKKYQNQNKQLKYINQNLKQTGESLKNKLDKSRQQCKSLEQKNLILQQKLTNTQISLQKTQKNLRAQIVKLKQDLSKLQSQYQIKFLEQKKAILQKSNKQIAKFRADADIELQHKEKAMKLQNDKRDRQLKGLLNTLNSIVQRKQQGKQKPMKLNISTTSRVVTEFKISDTFPVMKPDSFDFIKKESVQEQSQQVKNPFALLSNAIKPFTQHTSLQQKLTQCRRQIAQLRTQTRQQNINITNLTNSLTQKQNQINLLNSKYSQLTTKYAENYDKLITLNEELQKSIQDKITMEKYYDERWNTQINKVKYHMQRKHQDNQTKRDEELRMLEEKLQMEQISIRLQIAEKRQLNQMLTQTNKTLVFQKSTLTLQKQLYKKTINQLSRKIIQIQTMNNQDMLGHKLNFQTKHKQLIQQITIYQQNIKQKTKQLINIKQSHKQQKIDIIKYCENVANQKIKQFQKQKQIQINQKINTIEKHKEQIQNSRKLIKDLQKQQQAKLYQLKLKANKQKQKQIRDLKVIQFQQTAKLNDKIFKLQQKVKFVKNQGDVKQKQCTIILASKQKFVDQLKIQILQNKQKISTNQETIKKLRKQLEKLVNLVNLRQQTIKSLNIQINSNKLLIQMKQQSIFILMNQKKTWKADVQQCKKQFEKGFKELKQIHEKKINNYRSRIWELERVCENGGISKKDFEKIIKLNNEKKKLQDKLAMKQAQNLVMSQVKSYYQSKSRQLDSKMMIAFELKQQKKPVMIRKPRRDSKQIRQMKTQVNQDLDGFTGRQAIQIKNVLNSTRNRDRSQIQLKCLSSYETKFKSRTNSRSNPRINSSLM